VGELDGLPTGQGVSIWRARRWRGLSMTILNISFEEGLFAISEIIQDAPSASFRFEEVAVQHRGGARFHLLCLLSETRIIGKTGSEDATTF